MSRKTFRLGQSFDAQDLDGREHYSHERKADSRRRQVRAEQLATEVEAHDADAMLRFVMAVKSGAPEVDCPVYSHVNYDIMPGEATRVRRPDILVLEGLNVLQPPAAGADVALSVADLVDFSVYVDADEDAIEEWFVQRFLALRGSAFQDPDSFFRQYAVLPDDEAIALAHGVWRDINGPNLRENIVPTRGRATVVLRKDARHVVESVRIRRV
jgi:type I pantothenate kinase